MPEPTVLTLMVAVAVWWFVGRWCAQRVPHDVVESIVTAKTGVVYRTAYGATVAWILVGLLTMVIWLGLRGHGEHLLWRVGDFGEPPDNRVVVATRVGDGVLIEWRARYVQTDGVIATAGFASPPSGSWEWIDVPALTQPLTQADVLALPPAKRLGWSNPVEGECCVGARFDGHDLGEYPI